MRGNPFARCWDRHDRAITHRNAALKLWSDFLSNDDAYSIGLYIDPEGEGVGRGTIRVFQDEELFPTDLPIRFGEYFYNLRAALDYAVYATAIVDNGWRDPPPGESVLQYLVCTTKASWTANAHHVAPLTERHRSWIPGVQILDGST